MKETTPAEYKSKFSELLTLESDKALSLMFGDVVELLKLAKLTEKEVQQMSRSNILFHGGSSVRGDHAYELKGVHRAVVATWARDTSPRATDFIEISKRMNGLMYKHAEVFYTELIGQSVINSLYTDYAGKK